MGLQTGKLTESTAGVRRSQHERPPARYYDLSKPCDVVDGEELRLGSRLTPCALQRARIARDAAVLGNSPWRRLINGACTLTLDARLTGTESPDCGYEQRRVDRVRGMARRESVAIWSRKARSTAAVSRRCCLCSTGMTPLSFSTATNARRVSRLGTRFATSSALPGRATSSGAEISHRAAVQRSATTTCPGLPDVSERSRGHMSVGSTRAADD